MWKIASTYYPNLIWKIVWLLAQARREVVKHINTTMVQTYWYIGRYIVEYEQWWTDRAEYGAGLLKKLSIDLTKEFGKGFSQRNLQKFRQFFLLFPNYASTAGAIQGIWWAHIIRIMHLKDSDEQAFFMMEVAKERRSLRELDRQINSALYQRLALSKDKDGVMTLSKKWMIVEGSEDMIKDSYILEFLWLHQDHRYTEKELETAIINNLQMFLLEMGKWFSFVARQQRIRTEIDDYYIDLVFYNRLLHCHMLVDLKIGKVSHQDIGQMQMYVHYYDREIKLPEENPTIGLILCKEKDDIVLKYTLSSDSQNIFAKEYQLYLPNKEQLQAYLRKHLK